MYLSRSPLTANKSNVMELRKKSINRHTLKDDFKFFMEISKCNYQIFKETVKFINSIISKRIEIKPFPFPVYSATIAFLLLAGLADSIYLSLHHYLVYSGNNRGVKPEHASRLVFLFCNYAVSVVSVFQLGGSTLDPSSLWAKQDNKEMI